MSLLLDLIFPRRCYSCSQVGQYFCPSCRQKIIIKTQKFRPRLGPISDCLSVFKYSGPIKSAIHDLKYNFVTDLVPEFSDFLTSTIAENFPQILSYWSQNNYVLIPVPLHYYRQNWRGFNQSELIAIHLSSLLKLKYRPSLLLRSRHSVSQVSLKDKSLRKANVANIFCLSSKIVPGSNYLLFDDVSTTRSTLYSAASALISAGAASVSALTIAG